MQAEEILKKLLSTLIKTALDMEDAVPKKHEEEKKTQDLISGEVEEKPCKENKFHLTTTTKNDPLSSLSGGYNGKDFIESTKNNVMVPGHVMIKGLKEPVDATFVFSSYRYEGANSLYEETVKILTEKGDAVAEAIYTDAGDGILSTVKYADYDVHTSTGEMRDAKGHKIRINFDNTEPCKPRKISLVPAFGPNKQKAKLLQ